MGHCCCVMTKSNCSPARSSTDLDHEGGYQLNIRLNGQVCNRVGRHIPASLAQVLVLSGIDLAHQSIPEPDVYGKMRE